MGWTFLASHQLNAAPSNANESAHTSHTANHERMHELFDTFSISAKEPTISEKEVHISAQDPSTAATEPSISLHEPSISAQQPYTSTKEPSMSAKVHSVSTKDPSISTENPFISAEDPYISTTESYISTKAPFVSADEPSVPARQPTGSGGSTGGDVHEVGARDEGGGDDEIAEVFLPLLMGRHLRVRRARHGVAMLDFDEICGQALGSPDYFALAESFHTVLLCGAPQLSLESHDVTRRYVRHDSF